MIGKRTKRNINPPDGMVRNVSGAPQSVLRDSNFGWFLGGTMLTDSAQWVQGITLNWLIYDITGSGILLGALNLVRSIATVGLAPIAGVAIDRFNQRKLFYATSSWLFFLSIVFGLALLGNPRTVWPLFLFSLLGGIAQAVSDPLRQTIVFSVVPRSMIPNAMALVQTGWAVMRSIGPAIGGYLILWFGPANNFFVQAGAYALVMATLFNLKLPYARKDHARLRGKGNVLDGARYIASNKVTKIFFLMSMLLPLFIIPNFNALPPIYAKDVYSGGPDTLGLLLSSVGVGGIIGGILVSSLKKFERRGLLQLASLFVLSIAFIGFSLSTELWMGLACLMVAGFCEIVFITTNMTLLQLSIPDSLRGRVMGVVSLRAGLTPVGSFIAGISSDFFGPRMTTFIFASVILVISLIAFIMVPTIRNYRLNETALHGKE